MIQIANEFFNADVWDLRKLTIGAGPYFEKCIAERVLDFSGIRAPVMKRQVKEYIWFIVTEGYAEYKNRGSVTSELYRRCLHGIIFLSETDFPYTDIMHDYTKSRV